MEVIFIDIVRKIFKIVSILVFALLIISLLLSLTLMIKSKFHKNNIQTIFGFKPLIVISGSMKPKLNPGDLIFSKEVDISNIKKGDIIVFTQDDNSIVTHRADEIIIKNGKKYIKTKGDANNAEDSYLVSASNILGRYSFKIPKVGYLIQFVKSSEGFKVFVLLPGLIIILIEIGSMFKEVANKKANY